MSEKTHRLKGTLLDRMRQKNGARELPTIVASEPKSDGGINVITFTDATDKLPAGRVEFEVLSDEIVIQNFSRASHRVKGGYGSACFKYIMEYLTKKHPTLKIRMSVLGDNERAIKLYQEYGFSWENPQAVEQKPNEYHTMVRPPNRT